MLPPIRKISYLQNAMGDMAFWFGIWAVLPVVNQFDIGINFSIVWGAIPILWIFKNRSFEAGDAWLFFVFLCFFLFKFSLFGNLEAVVRYCTYIIFFACGLSLQRKTFEHFFGGMEVGVFINFVFAVAQMFGKLSGTWDGVLPVSSWNQYLWHANPPGGAFDFYPRVSGFANEPAYLAILLSVVVGYRIFVLEKRTLTGWYGFYVFVFFVFLINSRTAYIGYIWLISAAIVVKWNISNRFVVLTVFCLSFVLIPLGIFNSFEFPIDYDQFLLDDISIFARTVPLIWVFDGNNLGFWNYVFGVANYRDYVLDVDMPFNSYSVFESQGGFRDSKSLGGALFFDFGFLGIFVFALVVFEALKNNFRALLFFSTLNIVFFNVYAFSWPLFWFCVVSCFLIVENQKVGKCE